MKSKNGLAEDFINGNSEQEDKKKRENEKYLNFLRSQIDVIVHLVALEVKTKG